MLTFLIVALIAMLANLIVQVSRTSQKTTFNDDLQWYLFVRELESDTHQFELTHVGRYELMLRSRVSAKSYQLECKDDHMYLTLSHNGGGYLPLMTHVKMYHPEQLSRSQVQIAVVMDDGSQRIARVHFYPILSTGDAK